MQIHNPTAARAGRVGPMDEEDGMKQQYHEHHATWCKSNSNSTSGECDCSEAVRRVAYPLIIGTPLPDTPAPPVPTQPHDAAAADALLNDMRRYCLADHPAGEDDAHAKWVDEISRAYLASREEQVKLFKAAERSIEALTRVQAEGFKCLDNLARMQTRAEAAERDCDAVREELSGLRQQIGRSEGVIRNALYRFNPLTDMAEDDSQQWQAAEHECDTLKALARSAKP